MKITGDTTLSEIFKNQKAVNLLTKYHFPCLFCPVANLEMENLTLKEICQRYKIDLKKLLKEINKTLKK